MFCMFESVFATVWFEQVWIQTAQLTVVALSHRVCSESLEWDTTSGKVAGFNPPALSHLPIL